ncbi:MULTISPECIES: ABC transporter ATP-binding protein [unclassified Sphingomonas]|jgi:iron(III) transport system ATP-binding protein|uniref:ABC transporter ATP-binding protein n=2 Tax=Sphingomonas TaxID=13687 RepID=UPI0017FA8091|nr:MULTISPECIES: ABC transporter ATP-binding protein [unclassified Sphingomonas]MBA4762152.1 ABC transporter ATP-binding protein [Sphingomonas sp.]MCR5870716.1 ABC transporter ATP-binding protein [Sphingomonas sp. J344]MDK2769318.1 ABC transporter ATP-binding protein [Sphingomonas sp.]
MTHPVLDVRTVSRRYGDRPAVTDASFTLTAGGVACLLGPSGCGKSTLLRMIAGLEPVDGGEIHLGGTIASQPGRAIAPEDRGVGLVFQDFALFPHLNVTDNIGFGLRGRPSAARAERVAAMLARFHIEHLAHAWPHTLSGGEQQRVAIARALARDPALVLLDEPFSGLDGQLRAEVRAAVLADLRATGTSVLIVTHDPREAMQVADHLILMSHGQILQTGSPQDCYRAPVSVGAARLLGDALVFPAQIRAGVTQCVIGTFDAGAQADGPAELMVRPDALALREKSPIRAEVIDTRFSGDATDVTVRIAETRFTLSVRGDAPQSGQQVGIAVDPKRARIFR